MRGGFITLSCSCSYTEIDGGYNDFCGKKRLFKLKAKEEKKQRNRSKGGERRGLRRSQGQEILWERSRVKVELTCLSIGVY